MQARLALNWGWIFILLVVAPIDAALPAPGIMPPDHRRVLDEHDDRFAAVGRLNRADGGFCTAVLIRPDRIATAAHCLWNPRRGRFVSPLDLHFLAAFRRGTYRAHARGQQIRTSSRWQFDAQGRPRELATDWAIGVLERKITEVRPLPLAAAELAGSEELIRVGYGRDRPYLPVIVERCRPLARTASGVLLHDCDASVGDAGAPILLRSEDGYRVVAVQSAGVETARGPLPAAIILQEWLPPAVLQPAPSR